MWVPRPVASRSATAVSSATTACIAAIGSQGPRGMRGWSSRCPVTQARPLICSMVCAKPVWSRHGPVSPKAGMRIRIARGFSARMRSQPSPMPSRTRGVKFSTTASHAATSRSSSARPAGFEKSIVIPSLLALVCRKCGLASHQSGKCPAIMPPIERSPSMRLVDSTWITSAPQGREQVRRGRAGPPGRQVEHAEAGERKRSRLRRRRGVARALRNAAVRVCAPSRGAGRGGGGSSSSKR